MIARSIERPVVKRSTELTDHGLDSLMNRYCYLLFKKPIPECG